MIEFSFEYFPPASAEAAERLHQTAQSLARFQPRFASVTYGAGGSTQDRTIAAVEQLIARTSHPIGAHITTVGQTKADIEAVIDRYAELGVRHLVALRGDPPADDRPVPDQRHCYQSAAELVRAIRARPDGNRFYIAVAAYPEVHPKATSPQADLDNLKAKLDAGANEAITQFFYRTDVYSRFREAAARTGIDAPIVPGVMPITSFKGIRRFADQCGAQIPTRIIDLFDGADQQPETSKALAGAVLGEQLSQLRYEGVDRFHFFTMNRVPLTAAGCCLLANPAIDH